MNAIQQKCRPKHQVLVLKCYPRTTKGAVDVKPNSSELSYLLFYATSRKSKIQKIGAFLEKKTASDVWRMRIGNVQVTLGILAALVEKMPKDFALIAPYVLKILDTILRSKEITMIESSLPAFNAFCQHHDASSLFADQAYLRQYESLIASYAKLASTRQTPERGNVSRPVELRWRNAGLEAIKSIAASDALATLTGRQIDVVLPMILENLWTDSDDFLDRLLNRVQGDERTDTDKHLHRRTSVATVATTETPAEPPNPVALLGSALDVDKLAEEDIAVLAMHCLKTVFDVPNRPQIHAATAALLRFIFDRLSQGDNVVDGNSEKNSDKGWAIKIYGCVARWAPVQDRYVILVATFDTMTRMQIKDGNLAQHITLAAMIGFLLRSDVNLIGLSVMDVLLGLIRQMRRLFQLSGGSSRDGSQQSENGHLAEKESGTLVQQRDLLARLEQCVGDLATHVYYADQVSDMLATIIVRLKPSRSSSASSTPQGEKADGNAAPTSSLADLTESPSQPQVDTYFSFNTGRISALRVIKTVLLVANPQTRVAGNVGLSRNKVPMQVWEGTQWLLRDPDINVRQAYVDALVTWLERETIRSDAIARDDQLTARSGVRGRDAPAATARRAVSNASARERQPRSRRSQFLPLLHLSIYDNALQFVDQDVDIALLHTLLIKLMYNLGVNVVRYGVPMVYRLQEDVQELDSPAHKVRIAALCHGYFWGLTEVFDFDASVVGRAISNEIIRRRSKGFWVEGIQIPPLSVEALRGLSQSRSQQEWDTRSLENEEILPFDDRSALVEYIAAGYQEMSQSPPGSPATSPGRTISNPILGSTVEYKPPAGTDLELPSSFREQMLIDWSKDGAMASLAAEGKTESLNGSKTGTLTATMNRLTVNSGLNGSPLPNGSPRISQQNLRPHSFVHGESDRLNAMQYKKSSVRSAATPANASTGNKGTVASVEQLKMILSGSAVASLPAAGAGDEDDSGESMVSYDYAHSDISFLPPPGRADSVTGSDIPRRSLSGSRRGPLGLHAPIDTAPALAEDVEGEEEDVPPVPPLPNLESFAGRASVVHSPEDHALKSSKRSTYSRGQESIKARSVRSRDDSARGVDLHELLRGIDSRSGEGSLGNLTRPPY
ncbi:hypothetical protein S7711_08327 [Stachybotrys chartarum IBT 7711]|uniref:Protein EFR3 n=1 Tax=Stachybotrys chartarum (strain CBS 109288 / IBT 7711) TaxID=1280523 RepID=A0A084AS56_STACB|nr:hypothetical protein S7711_08327 [Stachybotrys chartarum IBT 7711]KFA49704.1 hypothetical protein S40293_01430 [Stachybotrys chartarum IBT 40293]